MFMKCIVCGKKLKGEDDVCKPCDKLLDLFYRKHPEDKDLALQLFREEAQTDKNKFCQMSKPEVSTK